MSTRRHFLQLAGAGAAASVATRGLAADAVVSVATAATKKPAHAFGLGLATYTLIKFPIDKVWSVIERVGLKHLCLHPRHLPIDSTPEQIAAVVAKAKEMGLDFYASGVIYMEKPEDVERGFDYAKSLGIRLIVGRPLPELLPLVNEKVQQYNIGIAIHNHGAGDKVFPTPQTAYKVIKTLDPRVGLCIDIGHTTLAGVDPSVAAEQCADRLLDVHMKDVTAANAKGKAIEVGRGVIDIPQFIRTLEKIGYKGCVSFEYEKDPTDPLPGLAESVGYVRGVMAVV